jgi:hypothetical protein
MLGRGTLVCSEHARQVVEDETGGARSMSTMVERVAQAARITPDQARAAIAAMREPTEEMIDAWIRSPGAIKGGWQGMIDAALDVPEA